MDRIKTLFLLFICVGPIHIAEQLVLGIDELYAIQSTVGVYYAWFPPAYADHATVILIVFGLTTVLLLVYAQLLGGTAQLIVIGLFGLVGVVRGAPLPRNARQRSLRSRRRYQRTVHLGRCASADKRLARVSPQVPVENRECNAVTIGGLVSTAAPGLQAAWPLPRSGAVWPDQGQQGQVCRSLAISRGRNRARRAPQPHARRSDEAVKGLTESSRYSVGNV
jgi:hypothetical protein